MLLFVGSSLGCGDDSEGTSESAFWPLDFETSWPEVRDCRLSPAEHDGYNIRVFASPDAERAYLDGDYPFVEGVQLVKGEYSDEACTELERVSGMLKLEAGSEPELGDWKWQRADASGRLLTRTPARSCAGCHDACRNSDYACTEP